MKYCYTCGTAHADANTDTCPNCSSTLFTDKPNSQCNIKPGVEFIQWHGRDPWQNKIKNKLIIDGYELGYFLMLGNGDINIRTSMGTMDAKIGDFIIKDSNSKYYSCKPEVFKDIDLAGDIKAQCWEQYAKYLKTVEVEEFKLGKCYEHTTGKQMKIIGEVTSVMYGKCLVGESPDVCNLLPVGKEKEHTLNWHEITEAEWMKNFSK